MNRQQRRAGKANAQARARKTAKVHDTLARRVGTGLDTLRALASLESGIPAQFLGVAVQGEAVQIWDTRTAALQIVPAAPDEDPVEGAAV